MEALTEKEIAVIMQQLETLVADLEHDASASTFYAFVLLAEEFARMKKASYTLEHLRRCVALAHRMRAIRDVLLPDAVPWHPLTDLVELIHGEATRLTSLYGVARPECGKRKTDF